MEKMVSRRLSGDWRPSLERFHRWGSKDGTQSDASQGAVDAGPAGADAALLRGGRGRGGGAWAELGGLSDVGVGDIRAEVPVAAAIRARRAGTGGVGATSRGGRTCAACSGLSGRRRTCGCASVWTWWTRGSCAGRSRGCLHGRSAEERWRGSSGWGGRYLLSVDGTGHFSSSKVHCANCCEKRHKDGTTTYYHQSLCAVLVHPQRREVLPVVASEAIVKTDGRKKKACPSTGRDLHPVPRRRSAARARRSAGRLLARWEWAPMTNSRSPATRSGKVPGRLRGAAPAGGNPPMRPAPTAARSPAPCPGHACAALPAIPDRRDPDRSLWTAYVCWTDGCSSST